MENRPNPINVNPYDSKGYNRLRYRKRIRIKVNPKDVNPYSTRRIRYERES